MVAQLALGIAAQHFLVEKGLDEMAEQALVEKFRCVQTMQNRQALGHGRAKVFQLLGAEGALAGVEQQGDRHVETLQGLGD